MVSCRVSPTGTLIGPSVGAQPWWLVRSEHFTVRSDVGQVEAREIAIDLERTYRILLDLGFSLLEKDPGFRTDVIIFRTREDYQRVGIKGTAGYYTGDFAAWGVGGPTFLTFGGISEKARPLFVHELTHRFVHYVAPQAPIWLNEGLADYFETITVKDGKAVLGRSMQAFKPGDSWTTGSYGVPIDALPALDALLTMDGRTFYAARGDAAAGSEAQKEAERKQHANYASAWAMVHALKNGSPEDAARLDKWLRGLAVGTRAQQAFDEAFAGVSVEQLEAKRRSVLEHLVNSEITVLNAEYDAKGAPPAEDRAMRPSEVDLLWGWALLQTGQGGTAEVQRHAEAALKEDPSSAEAHLLLAAVHVEDGDPRQAESDIQEAASVAPDSEPVAYALFSINSRRGIELTPARSALLEATIAKWAPRARLADTLNDFAWYMTLHGRAEEAVPMARRSTQLDPSCAECFDTVAVALFRSGQYKAAIEVEELAAGLAGERHWMKGLSERVELYKAVNSAIVLWKKRPEPGTDPSVLPASVLAAIEKAQRPFMFDCYLRGPLKSRKLTGAIVIRMEIGKDGKVTSAAALPPAEWASLQSKPTAPPLLDESLTACAVEQAAAARFPESSAPSTFIFPIVLAPPPPKKP